MRKVSDFLWFITGWIIYRARIICVSLWLAIGVFLAYKVFSGSGDEAMDFLSVGPTPVRNLHPATYKASFTIWIFSALVVLGAIWIVRQKRRMGLLPKDE